MTLPSPDRIEATEDELTAGTPMAALLRIRAAATGA